MLSDGRVAASGLADSGNTVLVVISIILAALTIVSILGAAAVAFGGSWRKSEMEMLRQSRTDLTSMNMELVAKNQAQEADLAARDHRITELTSLATSRQPFEKISIALEQHHTQASEVHAKILEVVERIASRLDGK